MDDKVKEYTIERMTLHVINYPPAGNLIYLKKDTSEGKLINYDSNKMISIGDEKYKNFKEAVIHRDDKGTGGVTPGNAAQKRTQFDDTITTTLAMFNQTGSEASQIGSGRKTRRRRKQHKKKSRKSRN